MKSIFRYPGGKTKKAVKARILSKQPNNYDIYLEPFVGGGGIFFEIENKPCEINDINSDLMSVYLALRDRGKEFIEQCREILPQEESEIENPPIYNRRLKEVFNQRVKDRELNRALSYFFINRTVWGGRVNYNLPSRLYFSNPTGWNIIKTDLLEKAVKKLSKVKITNLDYKKVLEKASDNCWIYLDPPYYIQTSTSSGSQLYQNCFTVDQHYELHSLVKQSNQKILISYDDNEFIRKLYRDFNIFSEHWTYSGSSQQVKKVGKELLITNY